MSPSFAQRLGKINLLSLDFKVPFGFAQGYNLSVTLKAIAVPLSVKKKATKKALTNINSKSVLFYYFILKT